ncbi:RDD family protein [Veronia pacifica]|uniref:RDD domain-containing protein n=1 Tax=Veronia pacifica TaxID=1080227 RepID=A0A1C3EQA5_9GAMM|nr:RDD family protein [Veronia pacifica]ODA35406.1 hypothetical protein A8L45_04395 [Veronia pacifica]
MSEQTVIDIPMGAGFFRRLAAWIYDVLVLTAVEMLAVALVMSGFAIAFSLGVSLEEYIDASDFLSRHPVASPLFTAYIALVAVMFFGYFWSKGGQTLGMRAWKLRIQNVDGTRITFSQALVRMATSAFGLGNLVVLIDSNNQSLQDMMAKCQTIKLNQV